MTEKIAFKFFFHRTLFEHYLNLHKMKAVSNITSMSPIDTREAPKIIKEFSTPLNIFQNVKESNPSTYNHLLDITGSYPFSTPSRFQWRPKSELCCYVLNHKYKFNTNNVNVTSQKKC